MGARRGLVAGLLMFVAVSASASGEEPKIWVDHNTGDRWLRLPLPEGGETMELMDQELPDKRMVLTYNEIFADVNLDPAHLAGMRTRDELRILKEDRIRIFQAPKSERLMKALFYGCLDRSGLKIPRVNVDFKLAVRENDPGGQPVLKAYQSALVLIGPKALKKIKDPGVLLFFMAHEYSHVVMQHEEEPTKALEKKIANAESAGFLSSIGTTMFKGMRTVGNAVGGLAGEEGEFDRRLENAAKRFQEDQADMLGADVLLACGYGTRDVSRAFRTFGGWARKGPSFTSARANMEDADERIKSSQKDGEEIRKNPDVETREEGAKSFFSFFSPGGAQKTDDAKDGRTGFGGAMIDSVQALEEETRYEHRAADARRVFIGNYFNTHYDERPEKSESAQAADLEIYRAFRREAAGIVKKYGG